MRRSNNYLIRGISFRLARKTVDALHKSKQTKVRQKVASSKLGAQPRATL